MRSEHKCTGMSSKMLGHKVVKDNDTWVSGLLTGTLLAPKPGEQRGTAAGQ